jgi:hypothetical protein
MKKAFWKSMVLSLAFYCSFFSYSNSQEVLSTPNIIQQYGWQGCLTQHQGWIWGGNTGGPCPVQRSGDGAILWSFGSNILSQTIAVNAALSGTGIQIRGYNYSWDIKNANAGSPQAPQHDPLTITTRLYDKTNVNIVEQKVHDYSFRINNWTTFAGSEEYKNRYSLASLGNFQITMSSGDMGFWAGYYGPEIRNINVSLRYSVDICQSNPLSSPDCPGYAEAFLQQQCNANPLHSPQCSGYEVAFFQFQCSNNPLYSPGCPGYTQAYFTQQCMNNPLHSQECPGYQQAYFNQQCSLNALYNRDCPGYEKAYFDQQCSANPLYNAECPGYQQAYFNQQCSLNALYNPQCPGYQQAYFNQQCSLTALYNSQCPGYAQAYFNEQCRLNPLYNTGCPLYQQAFLNQQCTLNQLYSTNCPLYQQTYFNQQCTANPLYNNQCPGYEQAYRDLLFANSCRANPQSSPQCPGYRAPEVETRIASNTTMPSVVAVQEDPVVAATQVAVINDPVVNQVVASTASTTNNNQQTRSEPLGQGLQVPGLSLSRPLSVTANRINRDQARQQALQTVNRAQSAVLSNEQRQQQDAISQMANVPGFDAYQAAQIPDAAFYAPRDIYRGVVIRDNARAHRALSQRSDAVHRQMVDQQYNYNN